MRELTGQRIATGALLVRLGGLQILLAIAHALIFSFSRAGTSHDGDVRLARIRHNESHDNAHTSRSNGQ